jgi:hypothetical protein
MAYSSIVKPSDYFNTKLYTGTTNAQSITGVGFQPDMTWIKVRSASAYHVIQDAVRGATGTDTYSLITSGEAGDNTDAITSFDSDGFSLGTDANDRSNYSGQTHVAWNWKANGQGSSNTAGSINTTYTSVNTTSGFSISSYTGNGSAGATVGHGLGVVPKMIIVKRLNSSGGWVVYNEALGNTKIMELHANSASQTSSAAWNNTTPSSTVFTLGDYTSTNASGGTYIAYCFAEKQGYSKFGSYTGNGNNDGTFVYTGFKPAFVMIKRTSNTDNWYMKDNKRSGTAALQNFGQMNPNQTQHPSANNSNAENKASAFATDILSNGFKLRGTDAGLNQSGESYIYMCFAEAPLVGTNNVPCTAR